MVRSFSSLRHRNYRLYFGGHLLSTIGAWAQRAAMSWLVWVMSGQEKTLGYFGAAGAAPITLFSVFGGYLAERFERRQMILITQMAAAVMPAVVALLLIFAPQHVTIGLLFAMTLIHGFIMAFDVPARQSFVVDMVGKHDLPNAVALNSLVFNLSRVLGPIVGGALLLWSGAAACFAANAVSYFLLVAALLMMKLPKMSKAAQRGARSRHPLGGFYYVTSRKTLGLAMVLLMALSIFAWSLLHIMPSLASRHLGGESELAQRNVASGRSGGELVGSSASAAPADDQAGGSRPKTLTPEAETRYVWILCLFGLGAFLGAMFMAYVDRGHRRQPLVLGGILIYAVGAIAFTSLHSLALAAVPLVVAGVGMLIALIGISSFIQMTVSDRFRGRVMGLYTLFFTGMMPLGALEIGWLAQWLGPAPAIQINLLALLLTTGIISPLWRRVG